ncbi:hypothetical protein LINGRAHAP2_LOCUS11088 [Linum grandiflorum]
MSHHLWGYKGRISILKLDEGFFLLEFPSTNLCEWLVACRWYIHHSTLVPRPWEKGIQPLPLNTAGKPIWITLHGVLPQLLYLDGISWTVSQIG